MQARTTEKRALRRKAREETDPYRTNQSRSFHVVAPVFLLPLQMEEPGTTKSIALIKNNL